MPKRLKHILLWLLEAGLVIALLWAAGILAFLLIVLKGNFLKHFSVSFLCYEGFIILALSTAIFFLGKYLLKTGKLPNLALDTEPTVGILGRLPITTGVVFLYLLLNGISEGFLLVGSSFADSGYNDSWIFAMPLYTLFPLAHGILLIGGLIAILIDNLRFQKKKALGKLKSSMIFNPVWILLGIGFIPTLALYFQVIPIFTKPTRDAVHYAATATPEKKLNDAFRKELHFNYDKGKIRTFLAKGADLNTVGLYSSGTALMLAASTGDEAFVKELLDKGADVNAMDSQGKTALIDALEMRRGKLQPGDLEANEAKKRVTFLLIQHGANLNSPIGCASPLSTAIEYSDDITLIAKLLDAGASVNGNLRTPVNGRVLKGKTCSTRTPLMVAAEKNKMEIVKLLLSRGADVNAVEKASTEHGTDAPFYGKGYTALLHAVIKQNPEMVHLLVAKGAKVNISDPDGVSALMYASRIKDPVFLDTLLKAKASVKGESEFGDTALSGAAGTGDLNRVKRLMALGAKIDPHGPSGSKALQAAIKGNNPQIVKLFIEQGVDVNTKPKYGGAPLQEAMRHYPQPNKEMIRMLKKAGAIEPMEAHPRKS